MNRNTKNRLNKEKREENNQQPREREGEETFCNKMALREKKKKDRHDADRDKNAEVVKNESGDAWR